MRRFMDNRNGFYAKYEMLSLRERQVAALFGTGLSNVGIGNKLHVKSRMIGKLITRIRQKIKINTERDFKDFSIWVNTYLNR